jgi:hypothetical protein
MVPVARGAQQGAGRLQRVCRVKSGFVFPILEAKEVIIVTDVHVVRIQPDNNEVFVRRPNASEDLQVVYRENGKEGTSSYLSSPTVLGFKVWWSKEFLEKIEALKPGEECSHTFDIPIHVVLRDMPC